VLTSIPDAISQLFGQDTFRAAGTVVIDGFTTLAGDHFDAAGDLWGWIKRKLFGVYPQSDLTGGFDVVGTNTSSTIQVG
jgi:hypothetical protein